MEVKGPRDRLSDQQRSWCCALSAAGLQVRSRSCQPIAILSEALPSIRSTRAENGTAARRVPALVHRIN